MVSTYCLQTEEVRAKKPYGDCISPTNSENKDINIFTELGDNIGYTSRVCGIHQVIVKLI